MLFLGLQSASSLLFGDFATEWIYGSTSLYVLLFYLVFQKGHRRRFVSSCRVTLTSQIWLDLTPLIYFFVSIV